MDSRVRIDDLPEEFKCGKMDCRCIVIKITDEQGLLTLTSYVIDIKYCSEVSKLRGKTSSFNRQFANQLDGCSVKILDHKNEPIV